MVTCVLVQQDITEQIVLRKRVIAPNTVLVLFTMVNPSVNVNPIVGAVNDVTSKYVIQNVVSMLSVVIKNACARRDFRVCCVTFSFVWVDVVTVSASRDLVCVVKIGMESVARYQHVMVEDLGFHHKIDVIVRIRFTVRTVRKLNLVLVSTIAQNMVFVRKTGVTVIKVGQD